MSPFPLSRLTRLAAATAIAVTTVTIATAAPASADGAYAPLPSPQRLLDTRPGEPTSDGRFAGIGVRAAGSTWSVDVAGRAGLGADPGTVVLNLTVDQPDAAGFLVAWPCDADRPTASNLNHVAGQTVAVAAVSRVAADGTVCFFTLARTHVIVDVAGSLPAGAFDALARPERLVDTRAGQPTIDGDFAGDGALEAGETYRVTVAGRGTVPAGATSAALNVTATDVADPGFLTVFPCDADRPTASNVNYEPGLTTPNLVVTRLDASGAVCVFSLGRVQLVVDVAGTFPVGVFTPLPEPRRLLDTRFGEPTFDGGFRGGGQQMNDATLQLDVAGRSGLPADVNAVVLNVTSTAATAPGFVTAHPQGSDRPGSSNLNVVAGRNVANLVIAAVGPDGDVCLFNRGATHLVVDVAGWLTGPAPTAAAAGSTACPDRAAHADARAFRTGYVRRPDLHRVVGRDLIAVYICGIPSNSTRFDGTQQHGVGPDQFAAFANAEVSPYFATTSAGRYTVEFVSAGTIDVGRDDGEAACLDEAIAATDAPFTNVLVAGSTSDSGGGFAGPGTIFFGFGAPDIGVLDEPPSRSGRGGWIGGSEISTFPDPATIVHEIGHTLHWPHSFVGPAAVTEYDNPIDIMSSGSGPCRLDRFVYPCAPGNTLAFNRLAADWLDDGQVNAHVSGTANYVLDAPQGAGLHLLIAPDSARPLSALTLETRVAVGLDGFIEQEGVAVHVVDQLNRSGGVSGLSTSRFTRQARGEGFSYDHLVGLGETTTIHGLGITVLDRVGDAFVVRVSGSYLPPGSAFFVESTYFDRASCAAFDIEVALDAGCLR